MRRGCVHGRKGQTSFVEHDGTRDGHCLDRSFEGCFKVHPVLRAFWTFSWSRNCPRCVHSWQRDLVTLSILFSCRFFLFFSSFPPFFASWKLQFAVLEFTCRRFFPLAVFVLQALAKCALSLLAPLCPSNGSPLCFHHRLLPALCPPHPSPPGGISRYHRFSCRFPFCVLHA